MVTVVGLVDWLVGLVVWLGVVRRVVGLPLVLDVSDVAAVAVNLVVHGLDAAVGEVHEVGAYI